METPDLNPDDAYWVGAHFVQPMLNRVTEDGTSVSVEPRVMAVLTYLAQRAGQVVTRDELLASVWADVVVNEDALTRAVSELRKLFQDDPRAPGVVQTIRGRGYRLIAPVQASGAGGPAPLGVGSGDGVRHPAGEMQGAMGHGVPPEAAVPVPTPPAPEAVTVPLARRPRIWGAVLAVAGLGAFALWFAARAASPEAPRYSAPAPWTSFPGSEVEAAISPEGARVAFAWDGDDGYDIYIQQPGRAEPFRLTDDPAPEGSPAWSPDGSQVAFIRYAEDGGIYTVPSLGGEARRVYAVPPPLSVYALDWSPDGETLVFTQREGDAPTEIWSLDLASGDAEALKTTGADLAMYRDPRFSPDGRSLAFVHARQGGARDLYVRNLASGDERQVGDNQLGIVGLDWLSDETLVVSSFRSGTYGLWRVDVETGVQEWIPATGERNYRPSASVQTGAVVYQQLQYEKNVWRIRLDGPGGSVLGTEPIIASTWYDCEAYLGPGGRIAFTSSRSGQMELWLSDADGNNTVQLTQFDGAFVGNPRWSPDGQHLAFYASPNGTASVYLADVQGGTPTLLTPADWNARVTGWTADGTGVYFTSDQSGTWQLWRIPASGGEPVQVTRDGALSAYESADGQSLYFTYPDRAGLWRSDLAGGALVGTPEAILPDLRVADAGNWVLHETGIYYLDWSTDEAKVGFLDFETGASRLVADVERIADPSLSISPDGATLLYGRVERSESDLYLVEPLR